MSVQTFKNVIWPIRDKLYRFALRIVQNTTEAEDVVQDVLSRLWRSRESWDQIENLEAWSMRITKNIALDHLRSQSYRRTEDVEGFHQLTNDSSTPLEEVEQRDAMDQIKELMQALPENQRQVIHLREIEELSYQEICEVLDMPMSQVKTNLFRARNRLKEALIKQASYGISEDQNPA